MQIHNEIFIEVLSLTMMCHFRPNRVYMPALYANTAANFNTNLVPAKALRSERF